MSVLDKLRTIWDQPADMDLLEFLGIGPHDQFGWDGRQLTVGNETVAMADVQRVMAEGIPTPSGRKVEIGDL